MIRVAIAVAARLPATAAAMANTVTSTVQRTTSTAGLPSCRRALVKLPAKLPTAAAAPIRPSMPNCTHPLASCALATNAGYKNRKPTITLMVQLPHREVMMLRPNGCRSVPPRFLTSSGQRRRSLPLSRW
ncbi:Uncharacterised protein [Mycobacterium tuberculosis]|uniref:Secreted protein n=1 Tax=Mycobacterium tuberculosis TaxID=1773 RepID=A0A916LD49_MYCTX|nr:Uncharacterised protein [Mycobacterium tuberculosis]